jgi:hypothetical protein
VCWGRLETLHHCLPKHYKSPDYLYAQLIRINQEKEQELAQHS